MRIRNVKSFYWISLVGMMVIVSCNPAGSLTQESEQPHEVDIVISPTDSTKPDTEASAPPITPPTITTTATLRVKATNTPRASLTTTTTPITAPKSTTIPDVPIATFIKDANCRSGPGTGYGVVTSFLEGEKVEIVGRNPNFDNTWWFVKIPNTRNNCWVSLVTANAQGNFTEIPIIPVTSSNDGPTPIAPPPVSFTNTPIVPPPVSFTAPPP